MEEEMKFEDFKLYDGNYIVIDVNTKQPISGFDIVYYHTTIVELINGGGLILKDNERLKELTKLSPELQMKYRLALYSQEYGQTESYLDALNFILRDEIEKRFINQLTKIDTGIPNNIADIVQHIFEYIINLDKDGWGDDDIGFGFNDWIENQK